MVAKRCSCSGQHPCIFCGGLGWIVAAGKAVGQDEVSDLRMSLSETFQDYAKQATTEGKHFDAEIWNRAADIARTYVTHRRFGL